MTINDLIERLEEYRDALGGDAEVRLMTQSSYPFENTIFGIASRDEIQDAADAEPEDADEADDAEPVVFICEGQQLGYGTKRAWEVAY